MSAVHGRSRTPGRAYCGRKASPAESTNRWREVTCADCHAASRADGIHR